MSEAEGRILLYKVSQLETQLAAQAQAYEAQIAQLKEELILARHRQFGRSSEKAVQQELLVFDEMPVGVADIPVAPKPVEVATHVRKAKVGRKPLPANLERVEILHDLPEADKHCACGHDLVKIGQETSERLALIPRKIFVERHIRPRYACHSCEGSGDEDKKAVRIAPVPPSIIPRSIATPSLLASILVGKFCDHLPFYRQETQFERTGIELSRQDMSNWTIKVGVAVQPLLALLKNRLLESPFIQMDETPLQVLGEPERPDTATSYMWLARGGPPKKTVVLYEYRETRASRYPASLFAQFSGYLQTDGYEGYGAAIKGRDITHVGCWAHARRKFDEAAKASKQPGSPQIALGKIRKLYVIERQLREEWAIGRIDSEAFIEKRRAQVEPILSDLKLWLDQQVQRGLPSNLPGKAIVYTLGQWEKLVRYVDRVEITPDNNACENAIRPFVLGRKNWLFSGSPRGAQASCAIYTLVETAKANGLNPWDYLQNLLEKLPVTPESDYSKLLPLAENIF